MEMALSGGLLDVLIERRAELLRFLAARVRDHGEAEDLVQDLSLRVAAGTSGPVANPLGYLYRAAANLALDRSRERARRGLRDGAWSASAGARVGNETIDPTPPADEAIDQRRRLARVARAIEALPPAAGRIFRRQRFDGRSHAEIATEFGISKSAVEKAIALALTRVSSALAIEEGGEGGV